MQRFTPYQSEETQLYEDITRNINTALTILFSIECMLKIFGFGLRVNMRVTSIIVTRRQITGILRCPLALIGATVATLYATLSYDY